METLSDSKQLLTEKKGLTKRETVSGRDQVIALEETRSELSFEFLGVKLAYKQEKKWIET